MARKDSSPKPHHGFNDIIGIVLIAGSLLLVVAMFSFDRCDLSNVCNPPNSPVHNLCGKLGAFLANGLFFFFGAGAFVLPPLMLAFGLGFLFEFLSYIRRRWLWARFVVFSCLGLLGLYSGWSRTVAKDSRQPERAERLFGIHRTSDERAGYTLLGKRARRLSSSTVYAVSISLPDEFPLR